ncbi:tRNA (5-methylaminomethyl-2-thiouridine)(34)-methyltransferase MnmD [Sphingobacterium hungaricum]|uniref:tRNA (5-methylaminomethyl-2-thiouridylate)-methyltransferase n=1 Tax=Sphingobacterium hungaricum TaxID=2082723 RepID=A0A928UUP6_9SPHI|nr:tRNA (5-methylaminomethyl-2-thiouridine)(34)-methyltransferase MnmD [Sphingobacterium hungaricum]MBE8713686.1 tRNA (5-methylaminomethyl-2-thiouridylate)-methyltransferase [Sphingobacterium hungaricum]
MQSFITNDGSKTLFHEAIGEHYHSKHGALQESKHVFLKSGLQYALEKNELTAVSILEVGFGTGLNFILTADFCTQNNLQLDYCGIEAYPLSKDIIESMDYASYVQEETWDGFASSYEDALKSETKVNELVRLEVDVVKLADFTTEKRFDVIYFDAFAAIHQPEMWTTESLAIICQHLKPAGVFVTYAITGNLKRIMKSLGFQIEKAPGAPGKREMLRAVKNL